MGIALFPHHHRLWQPDVLARSELRYAAGDASHTTALLASYTEKLHEVKRAG